MVSADPGTGLTWLLMAMASAAACGQGFLGHFKTNTSCKVLYMNAGMELGAINSRFAKLLAEDQQDRVKILATNAIYKEQNNLFFDLSDREYRDIIQGGFEKDQDYKLLIIDSFDSFFPKYKAKEAAINNWFLELKQAGVTVIVGNNSKTKIKGELLDLELKIGAVTSGNSLTLKTDYKKARNLPMSLRKPFLAELAGDDRAVRLGYQEFKQGTTERVAFLISEGMTQAQVGKELDISQSSVSRRITKAMQMELLELKGRYYVLTDEGKNQIKGKVEDLYTD